MSEQYRYNWTRPDECELFELHGDAYYLVGTFSAKTERGVLKKYQARQANKNRWPGDEY